MRKEEEEEEACIYNVGVVLVLCFFNQMYLLEEPNFKIHTHTDAKFCLLCVLKQTILEFDVFPLF